MTAAHAYAQLMSLGQWRALPEIPEHRVELQEGVLIVSPRPPEPTPERCSVCAQQSTRSSRGSGKRSRVELVIDDATPATVRVPDTVVCRVDAPETLTAADVALVVEMVSPGSRRTDDATTRSEYADAGLPTSGSSTRSCPPSLR